MELYNIAQKYLNYCELQKGLDKKTIKAYRIDLWYNEERVKKSLNYLSPMKYRHFLGLAA